MTTQRKILGVLGVFLIVLILVITGVTVHRSSATKTQSDNGSLTTKSVSSQHTTSKQQASATSSMSTTQQTTSSAQTIDVKNLSNAQAISWMKAHMDIVLNSQYNTTENQKATHDMTFTADDFDYQYTGHSGGWSGETDDGVYYEVRENHQTANMRAAGADPQTSSLACWFRITGTGELQLQTAASTDTWKTVSTTYDGQ